MLDAAGAVAATTELPAAAWVLLPLARARDRPLGGGGALSAAGLAAGAVDAVMPCSLSRLSEWSLTEEDTKPAGREEGCDIKVCRQKGGEGDDKNR